MKGCLAQLSAPIVSAGLEEVQENQNTLGLTHSGRKQTWDHTRIPLKDHYDQKLPVLKRVKRLVKEGQRLRNLYLQIKWLSAGVWSRRTELLGLGFTTTTTNARSFFYSQMDKSRMEMIPEKIHSFIHLLHHLFVGYNDRVTTIPDYSGQTLMSTSPGHWRFWSRCAGTMQHVALDIYDMKSIKVDQGPWSLKHGTLWIMTRPIFAHGPINQI